MALRMRIHVARKTPLLAKDARNMGHPKIQLSRGLGGVGILRLHLSRAFARMTNSARDDRLTVQWGAGWLMSGGFGGGADLSSLKIPAILPKKPFFFFGS